jgi:hypothetical protein
MAEAVLRLNFEIDDAFQAKEGVLKLKNGTHRDKVCILGFAPSWTEAPFSDDTFDIWCLNEMYDTLNSKEGTRASLWFEVHSPESTSKSSEKHQAFLTGCPLPIVMQKYFEKYPTSVPYPREAIKKMVQENWIVDENCDTYTNFSNQITWMIYMAVLMDYKEIHVYGVDMAHDSEYSWQRPSCEAALAFAAAKGIKVARPRTSELCHFPKDYGFDTDNAGRHYKKKRQKMLIDKRNRLSQELENYQKAIKNTELSISQLDGALSEINHDLTNAIV